MVPDILIREHPKGGWVVELNADTLPRVLVNNMYYARVRKAARNKAEKEYLIERFGAAKWLVKALHDRATTILEVATEIVRRQDAFFRRGVASLRPLILRDVADAIGKSESTISRVTRNKYIETPRGLYELKYFFTNAIPASGLSSPHSSEAVRDRIRAMIGGEPADGALSDERIVELLHSEGIDIARRTVAKYRKACGLPSSSQRRRLKRRGREGEGETVTATLGHLSVSGPAGFRGRPAGERRARCGATAVCRARLDARRGALVARRQSTAMPIGIAAMPSAIAALATRSSPCVSVATTTSASTRPAPNVSSAILV